MKKLYLLFHMGTFVGVWSLASSAPINSIQNQQMENREIQHHKQQNGSAYPVTDKMENEEIKHYKKEGAYSGDTMEQQEVQHYQDRQANLTNDPRGQDIKLKINNQY